MGNSLVGSAPQAIHPIEYYLSDVGEFQYQCSLGSTRFLKVAKCGHYEGECVVKVLAVEDPSLPLAAHKQRIERLSALTVRNVSIAAFHRAVIQGSFALIARQYVRYSLYDRLSTRPFLTRLEKCWLAYQLIRCVDWCHRNGVHHGDIKLENILITSSLWLVMSDLATYKPVLLPHDNPSDFSYFFDTSRRRCCNIAPERFVSDSGSGLQSDVLSATSTPTSSPSTDAQLTPQMDMFSVGCVLAELFSDDAPNGNLFDLADLLAFRVNQYYPEKALNSISTAGIRDLVQNLISLEPMDRKLGAQILQELSGSVFPKYFDTLYDYLRQLARLPPDAKIIRLDQDMDQLLEPMLAEDGHGLLLVLVVITSTMRALKHIHCKILAQRLSCRIANASPVMSAFITDRLLPYLLHSLNDTDPRVRAETIGSITYSLEQVVDLPQSDNNVFTDYILPVLCQVVSDRSVYVRLTLAANISRLSKVALNFLSQSCDENYDEELSLLHDSFQMIVSQLLTDSNNCVRRTLLLTPNSCANLCVFFGRHKTNEVILSHIITFLNDKNDFQLRASFFDNIIVIASYLGSQCSTILQPLLQQGLSDAEETIIYKTITSLSSLVEQGLLKKSIIYELVREALPLLGHPNQWINNALVALILTLSSRLSLADINCKIKPLVEPHLQRNIHTLKNSDLLKDSIHPAIPRSILDLVLTSKLNIDKLFECLAQKKALRTIPRHHQSVVVFEDALYTRLTHEAMTDTVEDQLVALSELIRKVYKNKRNLNAKKVSGNIVINKRNASHPSRRSFSVTLRSTGSEKPTHKRQTSAMNEEWLHMFGSNAKLISSNDEDVESVIPVAHEAREYDQSHIQCPPCHQELKELIDHKKSDFNPLASIKWSKQTHFKPKGVLVAHLHEHESAVRQVLRIADSSLFATCSTDGTVKVWDSSKMEGKSVVNRSRYNFVTQSALTQQSMGGMAYCKDSIIVFTSTNYVHILEIIPSSMRMKLLNSFQVIPDVEGSVITDITALTENTFAISLSDSSVLTYDIRTLVSNQTEVKPIWKLNIAAHERLITTIDGNDYVLFCGTSRGLLITFDLRFLIRSNVSSYPTQNRIRKIKYTEDGLYSSAQGNCEVTLWDCESGSRVRTLWASTAPPLSLTQASQHSVLGMLVTNAGAESSIITSGTDMRIRYWDLAKPERSYIISDNAKCANNVKYCSKFIEGIHVIHECQESAQAGAPAHSSWDQQVVSPSHRDCITDLTRVNHLLVSAGSDGVVKVWK